MKALRRLVRDSRPREERCELCGAVLVGSAHSHVVDRTESRLCCACPACAVLFQASRDGRYRSVPRSVRVDPNLTLTESDWSALGVPVRLAFFLTRSGQGDCTAFCPSPLGPTVAELPEGAWFSLVAKSRLLSGLEPDVEALLVRGPRTGGFECFVTPIDLCYELVAIVQRNYRGFDGGDEARARIDAFFSGLRARAEPLPREALGA